MARDACLDLGAGAVAKRIDLGFEGEQAVPVRGDPTLGDTVLVTAADGRPLARAAFSPASQIRARAWTFDLDERVDEGFLRDRVARAVAARSDLAERTDASGWSTPRATVCPVSLPTATGRGS